MLFKAHLSNYQLKACSDTLSSALNGKPQPLPNPAVNYKLRKSLHWSSSLLKCQVAFQIPATSNEQFVFLLSGQKSAGFHEQQFRQFSLNLIIQILFSAIFIIMLLCCYQFGTYHTCGMKCFVILCMLLVEIFSLPNVQ